MPLDAEDLDRLGRPLAACPSCGGEVHPTDDDAWSCEACHRVMHLFCLSTDGRRCDECHHVGRPLRPFA